MNKIITNSNNHKNVQFNTTLKLKNPHKGDIIDFNNRKTIIIDIVNENNGLLQLHNKEDLTKVNVTLQFI